MLSLPSTVPVTVGSTLKAPMRCTIGLYSGCGRWVTATLRSRANSPSRSRARSSWAKLRVAGASAATARMISALSFSLIVTSPSAVARPHADPQRRRRLSPKTTAP